MTGVPQAAAVCPHPPALVPQVSPGADHELGALRQACDESVRALVARGPDRVVVLGAGEPGDDRDETAGGTLAGYGADVAAGGPVPGLPLSLTVGAWLLDRAGWDGPRTYSTGHPVVDRRTAVLVMADGSATRTTAAPGFLNERAEGFDAGIAAALAAGDSQALAAIDLGLARELAAAGVPALRTLGEMTKGATVDAHLRVDEAPFGVGYWVADWVLS